MTEAKSETNSSTEFKTLLKRWKEQWPDRDSVPKSGEMVEMICNQVDGGEEFKRNFIVFVVSTCISRNQRGEVNHLVLDALLDLSKVTELNWARYTMAALVSSVDEWKMKTSRFFIGPILFLMVCLEFLFSHFIPALNWNP